MEETPNRIVTTMLEETRFKKDGTNNRYIYYERLYLNKENITIRLVHYSRPAAK
jgi:hypothetical protein